METIFARNGHIPTRGEQFNMYDSSHSYSLGETVSIVDRTTRTTIAMAICIKRYADDPRYMQQPFSDPRREIPLPLVNMGENQYQFEVI